MALVQLQNTGILKYIISQNCDGLHRKSGIHFDKISELHGNTNLEICQNCGKGYLRDFHTRAARDVHDHVTGRHCDDPECGGILEDSIINFGEKLPQDVLEKGYGHSYKSDLCIVLGSSLTVTPACDLPKIVAENGGKLVICNLQGTPLDNMASVRVYARSDDLVKYIMEGLGMEIPPFLLNRHVVVGREGERMYVKGVDEDGRPFHFLQGIKVILPGQEPILVDGSDHYSLSIPLDVPGQVQVDIEFHFMGHYNELPLRINCDLGSVDSWQQFLLQWNPNEGKWAYFVEDST